MRPDGQLFIRGRKKEMIVTPEGLNVFPEDVEGVLLTLPGVKDAAVIGAPAGGGGSEERVHAVLVLDESGDPDAIVRSANARLGDHQKIRRAHVWPDRVLPRTDGTGKLKRAVLRQWVIEGAAPAAAASPGDDPLTALLARHAGRDTISPHATIDELGLSSLERVELMVALENTFQTRIDEGAFAQARDLSDLRRVIADAASGTAPAADPVEFPAWNRQWPAWLVRRLSLPTWILPLARLFAWIKVDGREHLAGLDRPVLFAANHQSHMDVPVILAALPPRIRYRVAPAMAKEFFKAHFHPSQHGRRAYLTNSLNYYLAALFFNAFPLPQREAGARQTLQYIGEIVEGGESVLIFPEGRRSDTEAIARFRPGVGMIAARIGVPVVPVRIDGLDRVLHHTWKMARPGKVRVAFGKPMQFSGDDYDAIAAQVEAAVRAL
jgi:long-chain acyl-CoA synthetase